MNDELDDLLFELENLPATEGNLQRMKELMVGGMRMLATRISAPAEVAPQPPQAPEATADQPETKSEAAQRQEASESAASASA